VHLDLSENQIGDAGAESLAGVLAQCRELTHLDLSSFQHNGIGAVSAGRLQASWHVQASGLRIYN
jgi:Ran GTPase-activating protein (RanGAP) involved in mRNA processing and transport